MSVAMAALSALLFGAADFSGGVASKRSTVFAVLVFSQIVGGALALAVAPLTAASTPAAADLAWGAAAGLGGAVGLAALYTGLAQTVVAVVSPVAAVVGTVVPILAGLGLGERPAAPAWIGVAVAIPGIVALTAERRAVDAERATVRKALRLGILAGLGFGVFFVAISRTAPASGLWPLAAARGASVTAVAGLALTLRRPLSLERESVAAALVAGVLDMSANVAFLVAARGGMLILSSVVASLYSAPTVLLAWLVFKERLTPRRVVGLALAVSAVALMSV
jgi:drug/metabolite transporter (DMT)-like permease